MTTELKWLQEIASRSILFAKQNIYFWNIFYFDLEGNTNHYTNLLLVLRGISDGEHPPHFIDQSHNGESY